MAPFRTPLALPSSLRRPFKSPPPSLLRPYCLLPLPPSFKRSRLFSSQPAPSPPPPPFCMPPSFHHDAPAIAHEHMSLTDLYAFDDPAQFDPVVPDADHMIFDFDDYYDRKSPFNWDHVNDYTMHPFPASPDSLSSQPELHTSPYIPPARQHFSPDLLSSHDLPPLADFNDSGLYSHWITDPDPPSLFHSSLPIPIPNHQSQSPPGESFIAYSNSSSVFPDVTAFSPMTAFAALQPLPRSFSPQDDTIMTDALQHDMSQAFAPPAPAWATQLWDSPSPQDTSLSPPQTPAEFTLSAEDAFATQRQRVPTRRSAVTSVSQIFQSSSAPSLSYARPPLQSRAYSRRAESISEHDDRDATVRKKKRTTPVDEDEVRPVEKTSESPPTRSMLRPPKLAPSAWQLYFTDWIQRHQASSHKKLNVAQAAKEAGQEYAKLTPEEKEPYKRRSQAAKETRERELAAYMRKLTPDDIKRENAFRTAQRKAGKSRKGNIKDPNAPKKPLSAYFMFLQRIRSDPDLVREVFGDETETTKQSVLAAGKWRSMTDEQRKPFLAQAEQEKLEYESARKLYEEGTTGYSSSINFSILPSSPINSISFPGSPLRPLKQESLSSESDSEEFATDDGDRR
ncbi:hypothetical protein SCP_0211110 [Sparassis crispa]|uniref:HMG box domain-containing protein n=1 Tax=Sparassis crispa TaxID=139825 RepID=A0A401GCK7_9APHY|nr:hypothetical protein SCP_0211110 [Sparassis crispa]GBE79909.1 hypothetical protein SCP_0211110 [Sparassis crispa]